MAALSFPYSLSDFADLLRIESVTPATKRNDQIDGLENGQILASEIAPPLRMMTVNIRPLEYDEDWDVSALIEALDGSINPFYMYMPPYLYPRADPKGEWLSSGSNIPVGGIAASGNFITGDYEREGISTSISDSLSLVRATLAWQYNSLGVYESVANNVLRFDYNPATLAANGVLLEKLSKNFITNPGMTGASTGTPGSLGTGWTVSANGMPYSVVATGTEDGIPYVDIRFNGGTTTQIWFAIWPAAVNGIAGVFGANATASIFARLIAGSLTNVNTLDLVCRSFLTAGSTSETHYQMKADLIAKGAGPMRTARYAATHTPLTEANNGTMLIAVSGPSIGAAMDFTLRLALPQLETGDKATSPIATGSYTRNADALTIEAIGVNDWLLTFDDDTTQAFNNVNGNLVVNAANLNRPHVKSYQATRKTAASSPATVTIGALDADNKRMTLYGLPIGYKISRGDCLSFDFSGSLRAYHRVVSADVVADASGHAVVEVRPHINPGTETETEVTLIKPAIKAIMVPDSYKEGDVRGTKITGKSFQIIQRY